MEALEYLQAYIDNLLVITRGALEDQLEKLEEVLKRMHNVGKINAAKSCLCTYKSNFYVEC